MPTYMYKCTECGHRFEEVQGFDDEPLDTCPECSGAAHRVIGNVGVTFKGSGFYRTDSRKAIETKNKPALTAKAEKSTDSGTSAKTESKSKDSGSSSPKSSGSTGGSSGGSSKSSTTS